MILMVMCVYGMCAYLFLGHVANTPTRAMLILSELCVGS